MIGKLRGRSFAVVGLLAALIVAGVANAHGHREKGKLDVFLHKLERNGFIVQEGSVSFPAILEMGCQCELPSCYANNKSSTYGLFALPPAPNQDPSVENPYAEWFSEDDNLEGGWSYWWRLRPDEAAVFLGPTPPKVDYYGFTALSDRQERQYAARHRELHPGRVQR